jgi:hypothetical protein
MPTACRSVLVAHSQGHSRTRHCFRQALCLRNFSTVSRQLAVAERLIVVEAPRTGSQTVTRHWHLRTEGLAVQDQPSIVQRHR